MWKGFFMEIIRKIEENVCSYYNVNVDELMGSSKTKNVINAKYLVWFLLYNNLNLSANKIAKEYKRSIRDVRYAIAKTRFLIEKDKEFCESYIYLLNKTT